VDELSSGAGVLLGGGRDDGRVRRGGDTAGAAGAAGASRDRRRGRVPAAADASIRAASSGAARSRSRHRPSGGRARQCPKPSDVPCRRKDAPVHGARRARRARVRVARAALCGGENRSRSMARESLDDAPESRRCPPGPR